VPFKSLAFNPTPFLSFRRFLLTLSVGKTCVEPLFFDILLVSFSSKTVATCLQLGKGSILFFIEPFILLVLPPFFVSCTVGSADLSFNSKYCTERIFTSEEEEGLQGTEF
jgi:hypothetical protein